MPGDRNGNSSNSHERECANRASEARDAAREAEGVRWVKQGREGYYENSKGARVGIQEIERGGGGEGGAAGGHHGGAAQGRSAGDGFDEAWDACRASGGDSVVHGLFGEYTCHNSND